MIKITWQKLKKFRVVRAFLTVKILKGFTIRIGLPQRWAIKIAIWIWLRKKEFKGKGGEDMEQTQYKAVIQLTKEQAIEFAKSGAWKEMNLRQRAEFQILQAKLCMPFDVFHEAVEKTLGRPVYTHEFGSEGSKGLMAELFDGKEPPTLQEIMEMIPAEKRIIIST